jgi:FdhD protein
MKNTGSIPIQAVTALDQSEQPCTVLVADELPLTVLLDNYKIVTLMTLGTYPEALAIGYLRNQKLVETWQAIKSIHVNTENESIEVYTAQIVEPNTMVRDLIKTGCSQGISFNMNELPDIELPQIIISQTLIHRLLEALSQQNEIHRQAGSVHSSALCHDANILAFVEDVGRHNAVDTIAGLMWLNNWTGEDKIFYTTGRLTSEIVMKIANLGIPILLSRSGVTYKGIEIAKKVGMTLIAHTKGQHFLVFNGKLKKGLE